MIAASEKARSHEDIKGPEAGREAYNQIGILVNALDALPEFGQGLRVNYWARTTSPLARNTTVTFPRGGFLYEVEYTPPQVYTGEYPTEPNDVRLEVRRYVGSADVRNQKGRVQLGAQFTENQEGEPQKFLGGWVLVDHLGAPSVLISPLSEAVAKIPEAVGDIYPSPVRI